MEGFRLRLIMPTENDLGLKQPVITHVSNNAYQDPVEFKTNSPEVLIYGGYLHLSGQLVRPGIDLHLMVFKEIDEGHEFVALVEPLHSAPEGSWRAEFDLSLSTNLDPLQHGFAVVIASRPGGSVQRPSDIAADKRIRFQIGPALPEKARPKVPPSPLIEVADATDKTAKVTPAGAGTYLSNRPQVKISGTATGDEQQLKDCRIVIYLGDAPLDTRNVAMGPEKWNTVVTIPDGGQPVSVGAGTVLGKNIKGRSPIAPASRSAPRLRKSSASSRTRR